MVIQKMYVVVFISALIVLACASSPPAESSSDKLNRARSSNAAAQADMDQATGGSSGRASSSSSSGGMAPKPNITRDKTGKPSWVDKPDSVYDSSYYFSAVGVGSNRAQAEANAYGRLTLRFGSSVSNEIKTVESYKERVSRGTVEVSSNVEAEQAVLVSSSIESLIGAEINDVWNEEANRTYYAVAIMDKTKTIPIYKGLIDANLSLIDRLTNVPAVQRATIDTIAAYHLAASIADANTVFVTILSMLGGPDMRSDVKTGDDYVTEANNIAKLIPINVTVENDSESRIRSAISGVLTGVGFRTGNNNSRYVVKTKLSIVPVDQPNPNNYKYSRFVLDAVFTDTTTNVVFFTFNINGREGHITQSEADQRAIRNAEARVKAEYGKVLQDYLSGNLVQN